MKGETALVTGASSGIGRVLAEKLAKRGADLVLVARREPQLRMAADDLSTRFGIRAEAVAADLSEDDARAKLEAALAEQGLQVDILVNNAGFGLRGAFVDLDRAKQLGMIDLNVHALTDLAHRFGAAMARRGAGRILNVASIAGFQPGPNMAVYYASKAYVVSFSEALYEELKPKGVTVTCLCPGATRTEFADVAGMHGTKLFEWFAGDIGPVAEAGLDGLMAGEPMVIPGLHNKAMAASVRLSPRFAVRKIVKSLQS